MLQRNSEIRGASTRQIRARTRAISATLSQAIEIQSKSSADSSPRATGTGIAVNDTHTGVLRGAAGAVRRGRRSTFLRAKDCENLILAVEHAERIGRPLNRMLTVHFDAAGITDPVRATGRLLKLMGDWLRCNNTGVTAVWVREAGLEKGEHVHIMLSVPPNKICHFNRMQRRWFANIGAAWKCRVYRSRPIAGSHKAAFNAASRSLYLQARAGALHYLLKGADPHARATHKLKKQGDGGELWGKRSGTTENIGRTARRRSLK
jgi:hypothetical protein